MLYPENLSYIHTEIDRSLSRNDFESETSHNNHFLHKLNIF